MGMLRPEIRPFTAAPSFLGEREPEREGEGVAFARTVWRGGITVQPWCNETDEVQVGVRAGWQALTCDGVLPRTGALPDHLYEGYLTGAWRHITPERWLWASSLQVGSAGDRLIGRDTGSFMANIVLRVPAAGEDGWVFLVNEANNRTVLNYVPIPGVAYQVVRGRELNALIGIPFCSVFWRPTERSDLFAFGSPFGMATVGVGVLPLAAVPRLRLGVSWEMTSESFRRHERDTDADILYLRENRFMARLGISAGPASGVDLFAGWVNKRAWREGETFSSAGDNRMELPAGPVFGVSGRWRR